jgi:hypothetical protein
VSHGSVTVKNGRKVLYRSILISLKLDQEVSTKKKQRNERRKKRCGDAGLQYLIRFLLHKKKLQDSEEKDENDVKELVGDVRKEDKD